MRTNYKGIQSIVTKLLGETTVIKTQRGLVFRTEDMGDFRVTLVDGRECESEQGIHLRFSTKEELTSGLQDAIESVSKDNWYSIYIHQQPKPSPVVRDIKLKCAQGWVEANRKHVASGYNLNKLFCDIDAVLESMTEDQLSVLVALVSGTFVRASDDQRSYWAPKFHNLRRALEERGVPAVETHDIADGRPSESQALALVGRGGAQ